MSKSRLDPGELGEHYGRLRGWDLKKRNIMVEGTSDIQYFSLAAEMYRKKTGNCLLGQDMSLICPGQRDQGGTPGIYEEFPTLRKILRSDADVKGNSIRTVVALVDNDGAGRSLRGALLHQYRDIRENADLFVLHRVFPKVGREPWEIAQSITRANANWKGLDCEIEDMLSQRILKPFVEKYPQYLFRLPMEIGGETHYDFKREGKVTLLEHVRAEAHVDDLKRLVDALQAIRWYLGLDAIGKSRS